MRLVVACALLVGCRDKQPARPAPVHDAGRDAAPPDAAVLWPELDGYPRTDAVRSVAIALAKPDEPRFDVGGPVLAGELAIVASSQFGFAAIDYRRGEVAWVKPAGAHVAPPLVKGTSIVLVGDCARLVQVPDGEVLLGCLRVVTTTGSDEAYLAIRALPRDAAAFIAAKGEQALWDAGERTIRWRKGDQAVAVDVLTGAARPASATTPPLVVTYKRKLWSITQDDGRIVATGARGAKSWSTEHPYTAVIGTVWAGSPLLRIVNLGAFAGAPEATVLDMDATGSLRATFGRPTPGVALLGHAVAADGETAIAVRLDRSLARDVVATYSPTTALVYVWALPAKKRTDPVGVAVANDAVVVFHDGDTLTVLPALRNPTP
ncbi:MAG TPA: hypothetical protein VK427_23460 [Kofleriaceae bacterium]|nr:hypothetical protein [Kofleriaceae bacterium]